MKNSKNTRKQIVRIREKKLKDGSSSLYLDIYYNGKRSYEFLKLYTLDSKNEFDRESNRQNLRLAESIRSQRQIDVNEGRYGLKGSYKTNSLFFPYYQKMMHDRKESKGNFGNWDGAHKYLLQYCDIGTTFEDIDVEFVRGFKDFLINRAKSKIEKPLSKNTQVSYFNKFRACINQAYSDRLLFDNPVKSVKSIKPEGSKREYLTFDELKKIVKEECKYEVLKRAFIFSCLSGLRWSDIQKMKWSEVTDDKSGSRIVFKQKKTKGQEYLDINEQARTYLGERRGQADKVFNGLKYSSYTNVELQRWVMSAGISKSITFHCARHTFAVMQLELGTEIYTLSKLLGHSELKTTQIYAKIMDKKKKEAMNKIPDINEN